MTGLHWYLLGMWTVIGLVLAHQLHEQRKKQRAERCFLELQARIYNLVSYDAASNDTLRDRLTALLRRPR